MHDLISRQAAIDFIDAGHLVNPNEPRWSDNEVVNFLKSRPSAQPEIIRCRDCLFYEWMGNRVPDEQTWFCHNWNAETGKDDFCSYAERREE